MHAYRLISRLRTSTYIIIFPLLLRKTVFFFFSSSFSIFFAGKWVWCLTLINDYIEKLTVIHETYSGSRAYLCESHICIYETLTNSDTCDALLQNEDIYIIGIHVYPWYSFILRLEFMLDRLYFIGFDREKKKKNSSRSHTKMIGITSEVYKTSAMKFRARKKKSSS